MVVATTMPIARAKPIKSNQAVNDIVNMLST